MGLLPDAQIIQDVEGSAWHVQMGGMSVTASIHLLPVPTQSITLHAAAESHQHRASCYNSREGIKTALQL